MLAQRIIQQSARRLLAHQPTTLAISKFTSPAAIALQPSRIQSRPAATAPLSATDANKILAAQRLNRPISPHLSIYQPQINWYSSGLNRITGSILSGGFYIFGAAYLASPLFGWHLESASMAAAFGAWPLLAKVGVKFGVSLPFTYHSLQGVAHLIWDMGRNLGNKAVQRSGWTVVGLSIISSGVLAAMAKLRGSGFGYPPFLSNPTAKIMPPSFVQRGFFQQSRPLIRASFRRRKHRAAKHKPSNEHIPQGPRNTVQRPLQPSRTPKPSGTSDVRSHISKRPENSPAQSEGKASSTDAVSDALRNTNPQDNNLLSPVYIPEDPDGVLNESHPAASILANSAIVVQRQLELMNVMLGFEQANKYVIMDGKGEHIGYIAERELGMGNVMARQMFSTHRSFTAHVFDKHEKEVLRFHRPFSWVSSRICVYNPLEIATGSHSASKGLQRTTPRSLSSEVNQTSAQISSLDLSDMRIIGEAQQQWAPLRRKYNLFLYRRPSNPETYLETRQISSGGLPLSSSQQLQVAEAAKDGSDGEFGQFAYVDEPFLSWDFSLLSADSHLIGSVNRNFAGFGREIFTDTGVYALRMDAAGLAEEPRHLISKSGETGTLGTPNAGMTLDQRAVMLATAVSVDFDYFSRKSGSGGMGFMPLWFPGVGAGAEGAAGAEAAEGAAEGAGTAVGGAAKNAGAVGEGAVLGAGSTAGYEAMQRGVGGGDAISSDTSGFGAGQAPPPPPLEGEVGQGEDVWGKNDDPWGGGQGEDGGSSGGDGAGGGDGGGFDIGDWF